MKNNKNRANKAPLTKLKSNQLEIQVTRQCNLKCAHCAKGEPQNYDNNIEQISRLLRQVDAIGTLVLTGGEPFLKPSIIQDVVRLIKEKNIECGFFSAVTNGTILNKDIAKAFNEIANYCANGAEIEISKSQYHLNEPENTLKYYREHCNDLVKVNVQDKDYSTVFSVGRGADIENDILTTLPSNRYKARKSQDHVINPIQLCVNANISMGAIVPFVEEDSYNLGNIMDDTGLNVMIKRWDRQQLHKTCDEAVAVRTIEYNFENNLLDEADKNEALKTYRALTGRNLSI